MAKNGENDITHFGDRASRVAEKSSISPMSKWLSKQKGEATANKRTKWVAWFLFSSMSTHPPIKIHDGRARGLTKYNEIKLMSGFDFHDAQPLVPTSPFLEATATPSSKFAPRKYGVSYLLVISYC